MTEAPQNVQSIGQTHQEVESRKRITKAELLAKVSEVEEVFIESVGAYLQLRRLSDSQFSKIEGFGSSGVEMVGEPQFDGAGNPKPGTGMSQRVDVQKAIEGDAKARRMALVWGIADGDRWTEDDVSKLPSDFVREVAGKIYELSGVTKDAEELARFRKESGGAGDSDSPEDGLSPSTDAAGVDTVTG